jgi:hypothetical protein
MKIANRQDALASRNRMLAFVATVRMQLTVNPQAPLIAITKLSHVSTDASSRLVSLGAVEKMKPSGHRWVSQQTDEEIVDLISRPIARPTPILLSEESSTEDTALKALTERFSGDLRKTSERLSLLEATSTASKKLIDTLNGDVDQIDKALQANEELINLTSKDVEGLTTRVAEVERILGMVLRNQANEIARHPPKEEGGTYVRLTEGLPPALATTAAVPVTEPKVHHPDKGPEQPPKHDIYIVIFGVFTRDIRHINDKVKLDLNGMGRFVHLKFVTPFDRLQCAVGSCHAVVYTSEVQSRVNDYKKMNKGLDLPPFILAGGGNKTISDTVVEVARKALKE